MPKTITADVVQAVADLTALIREATGDGDTTPALPDSVMAALRHLDAFRLLAPRDVRGAELDPLTFVRVAEAAARADGSTGWCLMIANCFAAFGGLLPEGGARTISATSRRSSPAPSGPSAGPSRSTGATESAGSGPWPAARPSPPGTWVGAS
jgi:alkylation response protein AidB-like acyl-CoA dehydrogenase